MQRSSSHGAASSRFAALGFLLRFLAYLVAGVVLLRVPVVETWLVEPWTRLNAVVSAALVRLLGVEAVVSGTSVSSGPSSVNIMQGCNGVHALLIFLAAVLAFPASWRSRLLGVLGGVATILGFNLVRLINLILVARYFPSRLELFHVYIWQFLIIIIAFLAFMIWGSLFARGNPITDKPDPA